MKLMNRKNSEEKKEVTEEKKVGIIDGNKKTLKDLIAPAGIDATHTNHLEIISNKSRFARSFNYTKNLYFSRVFKKYVYFWRC